MPFYELKGYTYRMRVGYLVFGWIALIFAAIALVIPLVPITPFIIVSLYCFSRGSETMKRFLLTIPFINSVHKEISERHTLNRTQQVIFSGLALASLIVPFVFDLNQTLKISAVILACVTLAVIWSVGPLLRYLGKF